MTRWVVAIVWLVAYLIAACLALASEPNRYAVAGLPTPVLTTPDFAGVFGGRDGRTLRIDRQGQIRELEFIALPGTVFTIHETLRKGGLVIHRVTTDDYPYPAKSGYFVDDRFVRTVDEEPPLRDKRLPSREEVIRRLLAAQGSRYVWGGNVRSGVPELLSLFPPAGTIGGDTNRRWQLQGLDCSGLLYEATDGVTPRNTSALVGYGSGVPIAGLNAAALRKRLEPLDLIVWQGHVIIVVDQERAIESRIEYGPTAGQRDGVLVRPLRTVLAEVMQGRSPADRYEEQQGRGRKTFVIRRWYPANRP